MESSNPAEVWVSANAAQAIDAAIRRGVLNRGPSSVLMHDAERRLEQMSSRLNESKAAELELSYTRLFLYAKRMVIATQQLDTMNERVGPGAMRRHYESWLALVQDLAKVQELDTTYQTAKKLHSSEYENAMRLERETR